MNIKLQRVDQTKKHKNTKNTKYKNTKIQKYKKNTNFAPVQVNDLDQIA